MIGTGLIEALEEGGHLVTQLVRREPRHERERRWDPASRQLDRRLIDGADAVVNLAGSRLSRLPWSYPVKRDILRSRVNATLTLTTAMREASRPPRVLLNASATGGYGDRPGEELTEASALTGEGFLPRVVERWEAAARTAPEGTRVVMLRTGIVLGAQGFVRVLRGLAQVGLLSQLGDGTQHWPWISERDERRAILHLLAADGIEGPVNLVGPAPATADELLAELAEALHRPVVLKTPGSLIDFTLREAGRELFLADQRVRPTVLETSGFTFRDTTAQAAVQRALRQPDAGAE